MAERLEKIIYDHQLQRGKIPKISNYDAYRNYAEKTGEKIIYYDFAYDPKVNMGKMLLSPLGEEIPNHDPKKNYNKFVEELNRLYKRFQQLPRERKDGTVGKKVVDDVVVSMETSLSDLAKKLSDMRIHIKSNAEKGIGTSQNEGNSDLSIFLDLPKELNSLKKALNNKNFFYNLRSKYEFSIRTEIQSIQNTLEEPMEEQETWQKALEYIKNEIKDCIDKHNQFKTNFNGALAKLKNSLFQLRDCQEIIDKLEILNKTLEKCPSEDELLTTCSQYAKEFEEMLKSW